MRKTGGLAVTFYSSPDTLAFLSGWPAGSVWRQKWLAAPRVPERSRPRLATAEKWLLLRHPRAAATSAGHLREGQLQTRAASVGILCSGMLKYPGESLASLTVANRISKYPATCRKSGTSFARSEVNCSSLN
jgi:hypothetical protein